MLTNISRLKRTLLLTTVSLLTATGLFAQARITLERTSTGEVALSLTNTAPIAGIQFTINSSSNLQIVGVRKQERIIDGGWMLHHHQLNDSTMNVVILHSNAADLQAGGGTLVRISVREKGSIVGGMERVALTRVVAASPTAQRIDVTWSDLLWTSAPASLVAQEPAVLEQNFPNPFNPSTNIRYTLHEPGRVRLSIYDIAGREVVQLLDDNLSAGSYSMRWDGRNSEGQQVSSGIYFAQLMVNGTKSIMRMTLTK